MKIHRRLALGLALVLIAVAALACSKGGNSTPTATFQTFYNAVKNTDVNAIKSVMPKKNLEQMETDAKAKSIALDDALKEQLQLTAPKLPAAMPEIRNENIEGDRATLEFKDGDDWQKVGFIKEDDGWKLKR
jgi:hypothetical protein